MPVPGSDDRQTLLTFTVFQNLRTTNAGRMDDAMTDSLAKLRIEGNPDLTCIDPSSFEIRNQSMQIDQIDRVAPTAIPADTHRAPERGGRPLAVIANGAICANGASMRDPIETICPPINSRGLQYEIYMHRLIRKRDAVRGAVEQSRVD